MGTESENKIKFIKTWYDLEKKKLSPEKRILLLQKWIFSCSQFEEYEMAEFLKTEKIAVIREMRFRKIGKRTLLKKVLIIIKFAFRKWRTSKGSENDSQKGTSLKP